MPPGGLGTLPDYMQGMMSPDEFMRSSRETGITDFNAQNPAPPGYLGTLSNRSLFGGSTGQNAPLVGGVNKYNYAQRDAYQRAMMSGTQQAHAMNLQNTQQAQQMLNDNRNFGLNRQNMMGQQYLRSQELQQQRQQEAARLGLDTRVHNEMMPIRQQQANIEEARQRSDDTLGTGRLALDTTAQAQRNAIEQGRLGLDTRMHNEMMPIRQQQADTEQARQQSDDTLGSGRLDLDTSMGNRRAQVEEDTQKANAGIGYMDARSRQTQASNEATKISNEGLIGQGQLKVNQQQANTQQQDALARAYNENEGNLIRHSEVAGRQKLTEADLEEQSRKRQGEYFIGLQAQMNQQADIQNRDERERQRLQLDREHYQLSSKVKELEHIRETRALSSRELKDVLDYTSRLQEISNQKTQIQNDATLGTKRAATELEKARSSMLTDQAINKTNRIGQGLQAQKNLMEYQIGSRSNELLGQKATNEQTLRQQELQLAREKQAVEATLGSQRAGIDTAKLDLDRTSLGRGLALKERQQNLDTRRGLEERLIRLQEIQAQDRATKSQERQNTARVSQSATEAFSRAQAAREANVTDMAKARIDEALRTKEADFKKIFNQQQIELMRAKYGIEEKHFQQLQQDLTHRNVEGVRNFQLKLATARFNQIKEASDLALQRSGFLMQQANSEKDYKLRQQKFNLAVEMAAQAHALGQQNIDELHLSNLSNANLGFARLESDEEAEVHRHDEEMQKITQTGLHQRRKLDTEDWVARQGVMQGKTHLQNEAESIASSERVAEADRRAAAERAKAEHEFRSKEADLNRKHDNTTAEGLQAYNRGMQEVANAFKAQEAAINRWHEHLLQDTEHGHSEALQTAANVAASQRQKSVQEFEHDETLGDRSAREKWLNITQEGAAARQRSALKAQRKEGESDREFQKRVQDENLKAQGKSQESGQRHRENLQKSAQDHDWSIEARREDHDFNMQSLGFENAAERQGAAIRAEEAEAERNRAQEAYLREQDAINRAAAAREHYKAAAESQAQSEREAREEAERSRAFARSENAKARKFSQETQAVSQDLADQRARHQEQRELWTSVSGGLLNLAGEALKQKPKENR